LARRFLHGQTGGFLQAWNRKLTRTLRDSREWWGRIHNWLIDWLFVWKINYFEIFKNRTNLYTNLIYNLFHGQYDMTSGWWCIVSEIRTLRGWLGCVIYSVIKLSEVERKECLTFPLSKAHLSLNLIAQIIVRTSVLQWSYERECACFFFALFKTSNPNAIFPDRLISLSRYASIFERKSNPRPWSSSPIPC
jgi:hypothetical protein